MNGQKSNDIHICTSTPRDSVSCLKQIRKRLNLSQVISLRYSTIADKFSLHEQAFLVVYSGLKSLRRLIASFSFCKFK